MMICEITDGRVLATKSSDIMSIAQEVVKREGCTLNQAFELLKIAELDLISDEFARLKNYI